MSATPYLYSSPDYVFQAAVATDLDLMALDPKKQNRMCRRILANGPAVGVAAALVVQRGDGTNVTLSIVGGQSLEIQAKKIIAAGTAATNLLIHW